MNWLWYVLPFVVLVTPLGYLIYSRVSGKQEYKRFLARVQNSILPLMPIRACRLESWGNDFVGGVIHFSNGLRFTFSKRKAFERAVKVFRLEVEYPLPPDLIGAD